MLKVQMPLVSDHSQIISYELQIDDGFGGAFTSTSGFTQISMQTTYTIENLEEGLVYRLRYRVQNIVGWSEFSPILYVLVATVPSTPQSPSLISATSSSITLQFSESLHNRGSKITAYELWRDDGFGTAFAKVDSYTDNSMTHTVTQGLV